MPKTPLLEETVRNMWPCTVTDFFTINQLYALIFQIYFGVKLYMFRAVPLPIIRSLLTVHSALAYVIQVCRQLSSRTRMVQTCMTYTSAECTVSKLLMMDTELPETCRFSRQTKFVKLVRIVGLL